MPVRADLDLRLLLGNDRVTTVPVRLDYVAADPWAVTATFLTSTGEVTWVFGRELLDAGLRGPSGTGDLSVWPVGTADGMRLFLSLASPSGSALHEAELDLVRDFLASTYAVVPAGTESAVLDLDAELVRLLDGTV